MHQFRSLAFVLVATVVVAVAVFVASPPIALAGSLVVLTERAQVMSFDPATGNGSQTGTWVAAGAIEDTGTLTDTFHIGPGRDGCGDLTGTATLTGSGGTFIAFTRAKVCPFPSTAPVHVEGVWEFVSGTGKYAGIQGHGKIVATVDFGTGEVTIAREGEVLP